VRKMPKELSSHWKKKKTSKHVNNINNLAACFANIRRLFINIITDLQNKTKKKYGQNFCFTKT